MNGYLLALDQGTSSTRAAIISTTGKFIDQCQQPLTSQFPEPGWVEQSLEDIWQSTTHCIEQVLIKSGIAVTELMAMGISNQRETTCVWDRTTGAPICPAIVWQDRRTADQCQQLANDQSLTQVIQQKTGLLPDPYFSATKLQWILDNVTGARDKANAGKLAFGTIDTFLIWRLTKGQSHLTDASNASRTMLFNIHTQDWDDELLKLFNVPKSLLPTVTNSADDFGHTDSTWFGNPIAITGVLGDQQAASVGQCCFEPGMIKSTYGTGCFLMLHTGAEAISSQHRLITTVAYRLNNKPYYAIEGSIFMAGATVQWIRDILGFIEHASDSERLAQSIENTMGVYLIPAFTGLGAPYWDPDARGALVGLTRDTRIEHIVRAGLEAVCYQTHDLMTAMKADYPHPIGKLRVDGGMCANDWLMQFLSNILNSPVERANCVESSALGAAWMAGIGIGAFDSLDDIAAQWQLDHTFNPAMGEEQHDALLSGWRAAMHQVTEKAPI